MRPDEVVTGGPTATGMTWAGLYGPYVRGRCEAPLVQVRRHLPEFGPQAGPQTEFCATPADITVVGGAAYVGKTWVEVYFPLRYVAVRGYTAAIYRQLQADITHPGGLWDEAAKLYPHLGGDPNKKEWVWRFPSGAVVKFGHATDDERVKGAQISTLLFDELTHFERDFFWSCVTRNRSTAAGVPAQVLATTNPDADSWVAEFLAWWIDQRATLRAAPEDVAAGRAQRVGQEIENPGYGLPLPSRAGKVRYLVRIEGKEHWFARRPGAAELRTLHRRASERWVKSVRFIPGRLEDNQIGLRINPNYEGTLAAADPVTSARLLGGNWKVRRTKGSMFKTSWFEDAEAAPRMVKVCRGWDLAATEGAGDWTAGVLIGQDERGYWWVLDVVHVRKNAGDVELLVRATAEEDRATYGEVAQAFAWERAGAGKAQAYRYTQLLEGWNVVGEPESGPVAVRAAAWSAQAAQRRVKLIAAPWTRGYVSELEAFPDGQHDDQVAATLAAFRFLTGGLGPEPLSADQVARSFAEMHEAVYGKKDEDEDEEDEGGGEGVWSLGNTSGGW